MYVNRVTRRHMCGNRAATAWLIRRSLGPQIEILFVDPEAVAELQRTEAAVGLDAPGAECPRKDDQGRCSFEQVVHERLAQDAILRRLGRIVHGADFREEPAVEPEAVGVWAIFQGFTDVGRDDPDILARASFLCDSLYAQLRREARVTGPNHA
jgi:hypothetical protein